MLQTAYPDDYAGSAYNAAGQMIHTTSGQTDAVRYYDGNGREIKRVTANLVETSGSSGWQMQPAKYYVRSSVLGNAVVSEVFANGRKKKTFVRAAGAQIAYQSAYYSETSPLHESVVFEYSDASGMSQRTTDKSGAAVATGDGGEGSPAELDPMGSNVGTASPYVEQPAIDYYPSPDYPVLQSLFDDAPTYVNGQRVTATLDGMAVPVSMAMNALNNGSAIPASIAWAQNLPGFRFSSNGLGLFTVNVPLQVGWHVNSNQSVTPIYSQFSTRSFTFAIPWGSSWGPQQQQTQQNAGGGGGGGGGQKQNRKAVFNQKTFDKCLKDLFNTERTSEGIIDNGLGLEDDVFTTGVVIAGTSALLRTTVDRDSTTLGRQLFDSGVGDGKPNSGATFGGSGEHNYIASDVYQNTQRTILGKTTSGRYTEIGLIALRIHELGNAVADLRNRFAQGTKSGEYGIRNDLKAIGGYGAENKRFGINDPDAGAALEHCVFGGIVNLQTGRVGRTSRGL